jgi:hypothetical protein
MRPGWVRSEVKGLRSADSLVCLFPSSLSRDSRTGGRGRGRPCVGRGRRMQADVGQAFQPAGSADFPVRRNARMFAALGMSTMFLGLTVPRTGRLDSLPYKLTARTRRPLRPARPATSGVPYQAAAEQDGDAPKWRAYVAQTGSLYRGLATRWELMSPVRTARSRTDRLPAGDTAGCQSALPQPTCPPFPIAPGRAVTGCRRRSSARLR